MTILFMYAIYEVIIHWLYQSKNGYFHWRNTISHNTSSKSALNKKTKMPLPGSSQTQASATPLSEIQRRSSINTRHQPKCHCWRPKQPTNSLCRRLAPRRTTIRRCDSQRRPNSLYRSSKLPTPKCIDLTTTTRAPSTHVAGLNPQQQPL